MGMANLARDLSVQRLKDAPSCLGKFLACPTLFPNDLLFLDLKWLICKITFEFYGAYKLAASQCWPKSPPEFSAPVYHLKLFCYKRCPDIQTPSDSTVGHLQQFS